MLLWAKAAGEATIKAVISIPGRVNFMWSLHCLPKHTTGHDGRCCMNRHSERQPRTAWAENFLLEVGLSSVVSNLIFVGPRSNFFPGGSQPPFRWVISKDTIS